MNDDVANLVRKGIFVAIAAGNANTNAARTSPASEPLGCTAGASDSNDNKAFFSNYGAALDIQAPGVGVTSLSPGGGRVRSLADVKRVFNKLIHTCRLQCPEPLWPHLMLPVSGPI